MILQVLRSLRTVYPMLSFINIAPNPYPPPPFPLSIGLSIVFYNGICQVGSTASSASSMTTPLYSEDKSNVTSNV